MSRERCNQDVVPQVYLVDDDPIIGESLVRLLEDSGLPARHFSSASDFLDVYEDRGPCCLILDLRMPEMDGIQLQQELARRGIELTIIILSADVNVSDAVECMKLGAFDLVQKPFRNEPFLGLIRRALARDVEARRDRQRRHQMMARLEMLSDRERAVLELVVAGKANKQIAAELKLSEKMIEVHRARVMQKMQADSLASLMRIAMPLITPQVA